MAYRFAGKQKVLAIGVYPAVGLREARDARNEAKRLLSERQDPAIARRLAKAVHHGSTQASTFAALADELLDKKRREAKAERTLSKLEWLVSLARPAIGPRPIAEITAAEILGVLRGVESGGAARDGPPPSRHHRRSLSLRGGHGTRRERPDGRTQGRFSCAHR